MTIPLGQRVVHNCGDADWIKNLPEDPQKLLEQGWEDISHPNAKANGYLKFRDPTTGNNVRFDAGKSGASGFEGVDHSHAYNPNTTSKRDLYLDIRRKVIRNEARRICKTIYAA